MSPAPSERRLIFLVGSLQFIITVVFSMVLPLAPLFARDLGIPTRDIGIIGGAYIVASSLSGLVGTLFLDRFDRRRGLAVSIAGLVAGAAMSGLAPNLFWLIVSRLMTGIFSGPSYALALATIIDNVPVERRGRALGAIAGASSLALITGVPLSLGIANLLGSWRYPFFAVGLVGAALAVFAIKNLTPQRAHLTGAAARQTVRQRIAALASLLTRPACTLAYSIQVAAAMPLMALSTIMAVFLTNNLGLGAKGLSWVYLIGGGTNLVVARIIGRLADKYGSAPISVATTALVTAAILMGYVGLNPGLPLLLIFPVFFIANSARTILIQTVAMRIPRPQERAGFQSLGQSMQGLSMGVSSISVSYLIGSTPDGKLVGVPNLALGVMVFVWLFPILLFRLERLISRDDSDTPGPMPEPIADAV